MSNNRKPAGRPATPPPGANLSAELQRQREAIQSLQQQHADVMAAIGQLAQMVQGNQQQAYQPQVAQQVPPMTEQEAARFGESLEQSLQHAHMDVSQADQNLLAKLSRERKVRIYVDDPDVFTYAGERWPFNELHVSFDVPETIAVMYLKRKRERQKLTAMEAGLSSKIANQPINLHQFENTVESILGHGPQRGTGRASGLIQRSRNQ